MDEHPARDASPASDRWYDRLLVAEDAIEDDRSQRGWLAAEDDRLPNGGGRLAGLPLTGGVDARQHVATLHGVAGRTEQLQADRTVNRIALARPAGPESIGSLGDSQRFDVDDEPGRR